MELKNFICLLFIGLVTTQDDPEDAIEKVFSGNETQTQGNNFLNDFEEITPAPLRDMSALAKCGEGEQENQFVCVPYYNCDPSNNQIQETPNTDGSGLIDIRFTSQSKCNHYLEVCCQSTNSTQNSTNISVENISSTTTQRPVGRSLPTLRSVKPDNNSEFGCGIRNENGLDFTINGRTNEASFGEFPWMVAILRKNPQQDNQALCGGSLISPNIVLTAAHCFLGKNKQLQATEIKIRAGEWDTQTQNERIPYQERNVKEIILHEHFTASNLFNDVALLILERPLTKTDSIGTICLPSQDFHYDSRECFASGWGKELFGKVGQYAVILKKIQLPLVQREKCQQALRETRLGTKFLLHRSFICAGGEQNQDTCTGDGGSPLVCPDPNNPNRYLQVGIVAWGIGCGENEIPGVYVDVSEFREWIDSRLQEFGYGSESYT